MGSPFFHTHVQVEIWQSADKIWLLDREKNRHLVHKGKNGLIARYVMDHDDDNQRRVLGEQCRNAFEAGQCVLTYGVGV